MQFNDDKPDNILFSFLLTLLFLLFGRRRNLWFKSAVFSFTVFEPPRNAAKPSNRAKSECESWTEFTGYPDKHFSATFRCFENPSDLPFPQYDGMASGDETQFLLCEQLATCSYPILIVYNNTGLEISIYPRQELNQGLSTARPTLVRAN